jgi:single-strand DNA-binding protein
MINKYICAGYLSGDPTVQTFSSGKVKCNYSIGINSGKDTVWLDVECWDKIAENSQKMLKKGSLILIEGKLKYLTWKDKNNFKKNKIICVCEFINPVSN